MIINKKNLCQARLRSVSRQNQRDFPQNVTACSCFNKMCLGTWFTVPAVCGGLIKIYTTKWISQVEKIITISRTNCVMLLLYFWMKEFRPSFWYIIFFDWSEDKIVTRWSTGDIWICDHINNAQSLLKFALALGLKNNFPVRICIQVNTGNC